jgi:hypothetical protein
MTTTLPTSRIQDAPDALRRTRQTDEYANWLCSEDRVHAQGMSADDAIGLVRDARKGSLIPCSDPAVRAYRWGVHPPSMRALSHALARHDLTRDILGIFGV